MEWVGLRLHGKSGRSPKCDGPTKEPYSEMEERISFQGSSGIVKERYLPYGRMFAVAVILKLCYSPTYGTNTVRYTAWDHGRHSSDEVLCYVLAVLHAHRVVLDVQTELLHDPR